MACYTGFAAPNILSLLHGSNSPPALLLWAAALAALTLVLTAGELGRS